MRRTTGLAGVIVAVMAGLLVFALQQRNDAVEHKNSADHSLYIANMNLIQGEWDNNNIDHVRDLLDSTQTSKFRGFEWNYWNRLSHLELTTLTGHTAYVTSVAFAPDGRRIATGSEDNTAKVWDAATGQEILTLKGHPNRITSVAFSPDGRRIVTGSKGNTAKVWFSDRADEPDWDAVDKVNAKHLQK